jgi:hypothetical protein
VLGSCRAVLSFNIFSVAMSKVLHRKMITQCAMLEDFGIFLVLADMVNGSFYSAHHRRSHLFIYPRKTLFAYDIEALVPSYPQNANTSQPWRKLNGSKGVHFFRVGSLGGRTLVIYMKRKGVGPYSIVLTLKSILR